MRKKTVRITASQIKPTSKQELERIVSLGDYDYKRDAKPVFCYMDKVDYDFGLGHDSYGDRVFPSVQDLKKHQPCVKECGIVKIKVEFVEVVQPENFKRHRVSSKFIRERRALHKDAEKRVADVRKKAAEEIRKIRAEYLK